MTPKTGSDNNVVGFPPGPITCVLEIGEAIVWVKIEV